MLYIFIQNINFLTISSPIYHFLFFQNKRLFATFYAPKLIIVGLIWITAVTLSSWQEYNELRDPTYNYRLDTGNFLVGGLKRRHFFLF